MQEASASLQGQDAKGMSACCASLSALIPAPLRSPITDHHQRSLRLSLSTAGFGVRKKLRKCNSLALGVWMNVLSCSLPCSFWQEHRKGLLVVRADAEQRMEKTIGSLSS